MTRAIATANPTASTARFANCATMALSGPQPDAESAGRRALRNVLLDYFPSFQAAQRSPRGSSATPPPNDQPGAAALTLLTHRFGGTPEVATALPRSSERFRSDAPVLDKWFQIQPPSPGLGSVEVVAAFDETPGLPLANPNCVRSLACASDCQPDWLSPWTGLATRSLFAKPFPAVEKRNPRGGEACNSAVVVAVA